MWAIFLGSENSPEVMHLLKNLDKHSDTMQLVIFNSFGWNVNGGTVRFYVKIFNETLVFVCISRS